MRALATIPACMAVPQAMTRIFVIRFKSSSGIFSSERSGRPFVRRGRIVFFNTSGCSWISFIMKCGKPFFMAASVFQDASRISGSTFVPSSS